MLMGEIIATIVQADTIVGDKFVKAISTCTHNFYKEIIK